MSMTTSVLYNILKQKISDHRPSQKLQKVCLCSITGNGERSDLYPAELAAMFVKNAYRREFDVVANVIANLAITEHTPVATHTFISQLQ